MCFETHGEIASVGGISMSGCYEELSPAVAVLQLCLFFRLKKMGPKMCVWMVLAMAMAVVCAAASPDGIESPQYTVVHAESDFEIRLYRPSTWITTPVEDISFSKATQIGFHKYVLSLWCTLCAEFLGF